MNPDYKNVKAILFDSGHTLNKPKTGHWFIPPNFYQIVDSSKINSDSLLFKYAMIRAIKHLSKNHNISSEREEFLLFKEFYSILLKKSRYPNIDDKILSALSEDAVYNDDKFVFFDDVDSSIKKLSKEYILGIVSGTWPSLERVFRSRGLRQYFSTFIMSSIYGEFHSKTNLLDIALKEINIKPCEAIFIDDSERNLVDAKKLGIIPIKINRYNSKKSKYNFDEITTLEDIL